ncbi:MAG: T9SS type A sorting domain-containing protein [Bacteroidota bacterium]
MKTSLLFYVLCLLGGQLAAQSSDFPEYHEAVDDPYLPPPAVKRTSPAYGRQKSSVVTVQVNTDAAGHNILDDAANEPSIAIDPQNPNRMVIGWRQFDNVASNFRQAGVAYTLDGGATWTNLPPLDAGVFRSDPVLSADNYGRFFYNSLSLNDDNDYLCDVFTTENPAEWSAPVFAQGGDKQWMVVDNSGSEGDGHLYASWTNVYSICNSNVTRSTDHGHSFEHCGELLDNQWGSLAVGPDGTLYSCGIGKFFYSLNAKDATQPISWSNAHYLTRHARTLVFNGPNPAGLLGQDWIATDYSSPERADFVYVLASLLPEVASPDYGDPCDVIFVRSEDQGQSWSEPITVNDDNSHDHWQWMAVMSVAPNGRIDAAWLDTRDDPNNGYWSSLYYAFSEDAGVSWSANQRISEGFDPTVGRPNQAKMGDYFHLISDNDGAHLAWAATFNGEQDVYYSFIQPEGAVNVTDKQAFAQGLNLEVFPNPVDDQFTVNFTNTETRHLNFSLLSMDGREVYQVAQQRFPEGELNINADLNTEGVSAGVYLLTVRDLLGNQAAVRLIIR